MPASATAATSGDPYRAYGPTVDATTRVPETIAARPSASVASTTIRSTSAPVDSATSSSLVRLRPAIAQRNRPSVPCRATRYRQRSWPTKLVAPNPTRSWLVLEGAVTHDNVDLGPTGRTGRPFGDRSPTG